MKRISYKLTFFFIISFFTSIMLASENDIEWDNTFGGENDELGRCVQETFEGEYIVTGYTESYGAGQADVYLLKTDSHGNKIWEKSFGAGNDDYGTCVKQTYDGGYIISGYTESYGAGSEDVYLIKTNSDGQMQWEKIFGASSSDVGYYIQQTFEGGYIISGYTNSYGAGKDDVYLIKTDPNGNKQWEKTFGGSNNDYGYSVLQTSDAGYIIAGETKSFGAGDYDVYLIKTDPNGNKQWEKTIGSNGIDGSWSLDQTSDGGYIIAGPTNSIGEGQYDVYLVKIDPEGNTQWEKTFGSSSFDSANSVQQTFDEGYIIAGSTYEAGNYDVYLIKTDSEGNALWEKTLGGSDYDSGYSIQQTSDGGYIVSGRTKSFGEGGYDVYLVKLSPKIIYVDDDSTGTNDGTSWENAYKYLQNALIDAEFSEKPVNILVAQGIYRPGENGTISLLDRNSSFWIIDGVKLAGGYAGINANDPNARDVKAYETILSGDLLGDDENGGIIDNAYHVVYFDHVSEQTIIEGFTIAAGNAEDVSSTGDGGGIYNDGSGDGGKSNPQIINCTIIGNNARRGGGIFNDGIDLGDSSPTLINCIITENIATFGGGIFNAGYEGNSSPFLENCEISYNISSFSGGGIYNSGRELGQSSPTLVNCIISGNCNSGWSGGGIYNNGADDGTSSPILTNCIISGNSNDSIYSTGGGIYNSGVNGGECKTILNNCTITGNYAEYGSGIYNSGSDPCDTSECSPTLNNCIVWGNSLPTNQIFNELAFPSYSYCDIEGGVIGIENISQDPLFAESGFWVDINDPNIIVEPNDPNAVWLEGEYHLKSSVGRWDVISESWVLDDTNSPCIDTGDPNSDWSEELWPHGERINMGAYGGTGEASMSNKTKGLFLPNVAYIYSHQKNTAESFRSLLESYGCKINLIKLDSIQEIQLEPYHLVIVANDTQYESAWSEPNVLTTIENSDKPILGLGDGGYDLFGLLGLSIGNPYGGHGSQNSIEVVDPNSSLLSTPYLINIPRDHILQLYTETNSIGIYLWPIIPETVSVFGNEVNDSGYYQLVAEHNRYMLWGFTESPQKMTEIGKRLFINVVIWMANNGWEIEN